MREKIHQHNHSQDRKLSSLFQKKRTRQISRLKGNKAQMVLDIILDQENTPLFPINNNDFIKSLIAEHIAYARIEEICTITKIKEAIRNVTDRKWAQKKQKALEIDYAWFRHNIIQRLTSLLDINSSISVPTRASLPKDTTLTQSPTNDTQLSDYYKGWMERIFAGVDLEKMTRILDDTMQDDTPHPKKHQM